MELSLVSFFYTIAIIGLAVLFFKKAVLTSFATEWCKKWPASIAHSSTMLSQDLFDPRKRKIFGHLKKSLERVDGDVLEIGIGGGANLRYYPPGVSLLAVDPNPLAEKLLRDHIKKSSSKVYLKSFVVASSEDMRPKGSTGIADKSIAAVVCTYLLCSLSESQLKKTLQEVKRVLKPGGRFFFVEHVLDKPGTWRHSIQLLIESLGFWTVLTDGCHVGRKTWLFLEEAGFKTLSYKRFCVEPPPESWLLESYIDHYLPASTLSGYAEV